jgi:hypothetical protein
LKALILQFSVGRGVERVVSELPTVHHYSKINITVKQCHNYNIGLNGRFLRFRRDGVSKPRSFYKAGIEKLVTRWETVIASNGNYIID